MPQVLAQERGDDPGRQALGSHGALPNIRPESRVVLEREGAGENSRRTQYLCYRKWNSVCKKGARRTKTVRGRREKRGLRGWSMTESQKPASELDCEVLSRSCEGPEHITCSETEVRAPSLSAEGAGTDHLTTDLFSYSELP